MLDPFGGSGSTLIACEKAGRQARLRQGVDVEMAHLLALDQLGQSAEARVLYRRALGLRPNDPTILSNLGMSYVLEGDLKTAETHIERIYAKTGASTRSTATLFAMQHGLLGSLEPFEM